MGGVGATALVLRAIQQADVPVVLDADGLNLLSRVTEFWRDLKGRVIMTPHPGEFRRLASTLSIALDPVDPRSRPAAAEALAQRVGAVVVLKGAGTVVSDGHRTWVCERGHACLATGGTGDVLSGIIGGLVGQFVGESAHDPLLKGIPEKFRGALEKAQAKVAEQRAGAASASSAGLDLFDAARLGVQVHGIAGEVWASRHGESGLLASELADLVPEVMEGMRK